MKGKRIVNKVEQNASLFVPQVFIKLRGYKGDDGYNFTPYS